LGLSLGKGDIFGESVQEMYLTQRMTSYPVQFQRSGVQPMISVSNGHGSAIAKSCYAVTAISYCDLHKISLSDLAAILDVYPEFANQFLHSFYITFNLRQVSIRQRSVILRYHHYHRHLSPWLWPWSFY